MPWGVAAAVGGALITSQGAKSAAGDQADAARDAAALEAEAAAQTREDLKPWVTGGVAAQNKLASYLGTGMGTTGTVNGMQSGLTRDQVREQLLSQYTKTIPGATPVKGGDNYAINSAFANAPSSAYAQGSPQTGVAQYGGSGDATNVPGWYDGRTPTPQSTDQIDEAGLNAAIEKYYADQAAQESAMKSDPTYGSLLKQYKDGADFKFDATDLQNEAGYQFGLDQGMQGLDRAQASRGNFLSGAAVKQATRYAQDYAGTKANDAYTRQAGTWSMNKSAFDTNKNSIYNFLTGQSTLGQNSAARVGASNQQAAQGGSNALLAAGNASSAATIAGSNALASGLNGAVNSYNTNNPNSAAGWNSLLSNNGGGYSGYTGYKGTVDPIANLNTTNGWTN